MKKARNVDRPFTRAIRRNKASLEASNSGVGKANINSLNVDSDKLHPRYGKATIIPMFQALMNAIVALSVVTMRGNHFGKDIDVGNPPGESESTEFFHKVNEFMKKQIGRSQ